MVDVSVKPPRAAVSQERKIVTASDIAHFLRLRPAGPNEWRGLCPLHHDKVPSFSINDKLGRPYACCHAGCSQRDVIGYLQDNGLWPGKRNGVAFEEVTYEKRRVLDRQNEAEIEGRRREAEAIFYSCSPDIENTPAEAYLRRRGIWDARSDDFRFGVIPYGKQKWCLPALVVPRLDTRTHEFRGIQRIYLQSDGRKYERGTAKLSLGSGVGAAALLHEPADRLILAEGMETALAAMLLFHAPAWAMCGGFPKDIWLPRSVKHVLLAADNDAETNKNGLPKQTSFMKAEVLRPRIEQTGRRVSVRMPKTVGADYDDVLLGKAT